MNPKIFFLALGVFVSSVINAQNVGINTKTPAATLDVAGKPSETAKPDGVIAPRLKRSELIAKSASYGADQTGAIVYVTDLSGTTNTATAEVKAVGHYLFNGTKFSPLSPFQPAYGEVVSTASPGLEANGDIIMATVTLPSNGTYLIIYSCRATQSGGTPNGYLPSIIATYLTSGAGSTTAIPDTEILISKTYNNGDGSTGTGTLIRTVTTGTEVINMRLKVKDWGAASSNDAYGRSKITYVKIAP